jgi:aspartyl-tRNA(Asn)/glutamyl-tRNA(Gln) amidotransferase subunit A
MDLPPWTAEEIAAQAAKLGTELTLEAVTDLLAAVETIEPTVGRAAAPLTAAARRPDRSGRCGRLATRRRAGRAMTDPLSLEAAAVLQAGDTTPVEVLAAVRARIAAVNPVPNSVITVIGDRAAEESTRRWRAGAPGALEGIPFGVKGVIDAEGVPTTAGSTIYDGRIAQRSAEVVRRAEEAGAIAVTEDATTEFAIGGPHNPGFSPGAQPVGHLALDRWILDRFSRGALLPARDRHPLPTLPRSGASRSEVPVFSGQRSAVTPRIPRKAVGTSRDRR